MPEPARLKDIAEPLGVSEVTVSNALSGKKGVSDKLRSLILDKAREINFDLSRYDRKKNYSPLVGVIISKSIIDKKSQFYRALYEKLILAAAEEGLLVVTEHICEEGEDEALPQLASAGKTDGLFLLGEMQDSLICRLKGQADIPVVLLNYYKPSLGCDSVICNDYMGMYEVTEYLIRRGHREIAFVGTGGRSEAARERFCGFLKCMSEYRLPVRPEWIIEREDSELPDSIPASSGALPTAFACSGDSAAASVLRALKELGLRVPQDMSLAGYGGCDDDPSDSMLWTGMTGYAVDMKAMAQEAVRVMMKRIEGYKGEPRVWSVVSHIVEKNSVRAIF